MDNILYITFIKLFPIDIINIILLYSGKRLIIQMQHYFPKLLKHIEYGRDFDLRGFTHLHRNKNIHAPV
jgi:hypothetical protein